MKNAKTLPRLMLLEWNPPVYLPRYYQNLSHADVIDVREIIRGCNCRHRGSVSDSDHRQIFTGPYGVSLRLRGYGTASATGTTAIFARDGYSNRNR